MKTVKYIVGVVIISLIVTALILIPKPTKNLASDAQIAATIFPIYDITQQIAGDDVEVALILPPGASPHTYEPTPSDIRQLQNVEVVYSVGYGLDDWSQTISESVGSRIMIVEAGIDLRESEEEDGHHGGEFDPHYFLTISNAKLIAQNIADDLKVRFPEQSNTIDDNLNSFLIELDVADQEIKNELSMIDNRNIITFHDAWFYFADEYGLNIVGTFEPSAGREPTPQYLVELTQALEQSQTKVIYSEPQLSTQSIQAFITDNNLTIAELDPIGGAEGRDSYVKLIKYNAQIISQNQ